MKKKPLNCCFCAFANKLFHRQFMLPLNFRRNFFPSPLRWWFFFSKIGMSKWMKGNYFFFFFLLAKYHYYAINFLLVFFSSYLLYGIVWLLADPFPSHSIKFVQFFPSVIFKMCQQIINNVDENTPKPKCHVRAKRVDNCLLHANFLFFFSSVCFYRIAVPVAYVK